MKFPENFLNTMQTIFTDKEIRRPQQTSSKQCLGGELLQQLQGGATVCIFFLRLLACKASSRCEGGVFELQKGNLLILMTFLISVPLIVTI